MTVPLIINFYIQRLKVNVVPGISV